MTLPRAPSTLLVDGIGVCRASPEVKVAFVAPEVAGSRWCLGGNDTETPRVTIAGLLHPRPDGGG